MKIKEAREVGIKLEVGMTVRNSSNDFTFKVKHHMLEQLNRDVHNIYEIVDLPNFSEVTPCK